jgi:hypothetical protein
VRQQINKTPAIVLRSKLVFCLVLLSALSLAESGSPAQQQHTAPVLTAGEKETVKSFENRVKEYVKLRERVEAKQLPGHSKDAKPEEIEAHKKAFEEMVRNARRGAKPGDLFSTDIAGYIRATIRTEFKGTDRKQLRETVLEADTKGVPLRVNYPYPETKELTQIPPTLLLKLPQLPKQVKFRFVGRHLLLVDRENPLLTIKRAS